MQNLAFYVSVSDLTQVKALSASDPSLIVQVCACPNGTQATPLAYAISLQNVPIVKALLEAGDSKNHKYAEILTKQLVSVVKANNKELLKILLVHGAELHGSETDNAFFAAARDGHTQMLDLMIDYGASINMCDSAGFTVLMRAVEDKRLPMVIHLLKKGAPVNFMNKRTGQTALFRAAEKKMPGAVELLLQKGASVTEADYDGDTVLMKAINPFQPPKASNPYYSVQPVAQPAAPSEEEVNKTIELLINAGAELNARNEVGAYALHMAIATRNYTAINLLIAGGADLDVQQRKTGHTALLACFHQYYNEGIRKTQALLDHGADPDLEDNQGNTVLGLAIQAHDTYLVQDLLKRGAKLSANSKWIEYAAANCSGAMQRVLKQGQADAVAAKARKPKQPVVVNLTSDHAPSTSTADVDSKNTRKPRAAGARASNSTTGGTTGGASTSAKAAKKEAAVKNEGDTGNTWLAPLLTARQVAVRSVRLCEEKLVRGEGFTTEEVFATVPAQTLTAAYFERIGITALGLQQHLIAVHAELGGARTGAGSAVKGKNGSTPTRSKKQKPASWADALLAKECNMSANDLQTTLENLYDVHATEESFLSQENAKLAAHLEYDVDIGNASARLVLCNFHVTRNAEVKQENEPKAKKQRK